MCASGQRMNKHLLTFLFTFPFETDTRHCVCATFKIKFTSSMVKKTTVTIKIESYIFLQLHSLTLFIMQTDLLNQYSVTIIQFKIELI